MLQEFLNGGFLVATRGPGSPGNEAAYFGTNTFLAIVDFQKNARIHPASGYFDPISRAYVNASEPGRDAGLTTSYLSLARNFTRTGTFTAFSATKSTGFPFFVVNSTSIGFFTFLWASN
jgi:hypothetical protein